MGEETTGTLPGLEGASNTITGKVDPTALGSQGAPTGEGGFSRATPDDILAARREGGGSPTSPRRGPGRPRKDGSPTGSPRPSSGGGSGGTKPKPPPVATPYEPPPADGEPFVPWQAQDFVGVFAGSFQATAWVLYPGEPDAQAPWNAIGGSLTPLAEGGFKIEPPSPAVLLMAERAAAVANKWKLRMIFKEEIMLISAIGMGAFACVMASEEIRAKRKSESASGKKLP